MTFLFLPVGRSPATTLEGSGLIRGSIIRTNDGLTPQNQIKTPHTHKAYRERGREGERARYIDIRYGAAAGWHLEGQGWWWGDGDWGGGRMRRVPAAVWRMLWVGGWY